MSFKEYTSIQRSRCYFTFSAYVLFSLSLSHSFPFCLLLAHLSRFFYPATCCFVAAINYLVACTTSLQYTDIDVTMLKTWARCYCYFICIGTPPETISFFGFVEFIQSDVVFFCSFACFIKRLRERSDIWQKKKKTTLSL